METTTTAQKFDFSDRTAIDSDAYVIKMREKQRLTAQTELVLELQAHAIFNEDYDCNNCYDDELEQTIDIYNWFAYSCDDEWTQDKLANSNIPFIANRFGLWIGQDSSSFESMLVDLCNALYNS